MVAENFQKGFVVILQFKYGLPSFFDALILSFVLVAGIIDVTLRLGDFKCCYRAEVADLIQKTQKKEVAWCKLTTENKCIYFVFRL